MKFYLTSSGCSPVEEFLRGQSFEIRTCFIDAVNLLLAGEVIAMPLGRSLASIHAGLHELRLKDRAGHVRVFYLIKKGDGIYMLHAMRKKSRVIPGRDVKIILKRISEV